MTRRTVIVAFVLALSTTLLTADRASAQFVRRGPVARTLGNLPISPWMWNYYQSQNRRNAVVIVPPATNQPASPGSVPTQKVEIRVMLPVAGATLAVNGVDFGKTEYYERRLHVPESPEGITHEYTVSAHWIANGKSVTQERVVKIHKTGTATANFLVAP